MARARKERSGYAAWPREDHARWLRAGNAFGRHLMAARDYARERIDSRATPAARAVAERAIHDALYGVMMLLDGVADTALDRRHAIEYVLQARVRDRGSSEVLETFELAPDGDGLCMGFAGWSRGDFGA